MEDGALTLQARTEVTGIDVVNGPVTAVRITEGTITTDTIVVACGVWSQRIAQFANAHIPLDPSRRPRRPRGYTPPG